MLNVIHKPFMLSIVMVSIVILSVVAHCCGYKYGFNANLALTRSLALQSCIISYHLD